MCVLFFNDTATTEVYTLSLHDALPISRGRRRRTSGPSTGRRPPAWPARTTCWRSGSGRSEEHTSELQSQSNLVCRLLLEKKKSYHGPFADDVWSRAMAFSLKSCLSDLT